MVTSRTELLQFVLRKIESMTRLDEDDRAALRRLPLRIECVPADYYLVREGAGASRCCLLADGYACRHKILRNGRRQIVSFHVRGDILDLQHLLFPIADHNVQTLTESVVGWVPSRELRQLAHERPAIGDALWRDTLIDASIFREWVLNVGQRDARERIAHLLCEFAARGHAVGLGSAQGFDLPMTQAEIGDATGLTAVHVNRTLRVLKEQGVIAQDRRQLIVRDWPSLARIAGFHPRYLHSSVLRAA